MGTPTNTIITMLIIMLCINIGLTFLDEGVKSLNPNFDMEYNHSSSPYSKYLNNGDIYEGTSIDGTYLPTGDDVSAGDSDDGWNIFKKAKEWFQTSKMGTVLNVVGNVLGQPYGFLKSIGVPPAIATAIQVIWALVALISITAFIMGRT